MPFLNWDFEAANTEVQAFSPPVGDDYYIMRTRVPPDGVSAFGSWNGFNHANQAVVTDVEVSLSGGELLMQMHNDYAEWGLGRLQWDTDLPSGNPKHYLERKAVRLPASMAPYEDYFATWYSFCEYRNGLNWLGDLDTQYQINIFTRAAWDYLLFSPTINHYNNSNGFFENRWGGAPTIKVPIDSTFELQQLMRNSLGSDGRWLCMIKLAGGKWQVLFDYQGRTAHPDATELEDFNFHNPLKIYTNSAVIDYMNSNAGIAALACSHITAWQDS